MAHRGLVQCLHRSPFLPSWTFASTLFALSTPSRRAAAGSAASTVQTRTVKSHASPAASRKPVIVKPRAASNTIGLNSIKDNPGARVYRKRWGRGLGSGRGKRSGRGNKGWLNRHSGQPGPRGFEGGQTTFFHVVPKHGVRLSRPLRKHFPVQLNKLQYWIDRGRIDPTKPITTLVLYKSGLVQSIKDGVAILAEGAEAFTTRDVEIRVAKVSAQAIRRIEELGGKVVTSHLTRAERLYYARPDKFAVPPRPSIPRDMNLLRHYLAESKRGNLTLEKVGERAIIRLKKD